MQLTNEVMKMMKEQEAVASRGATFRLLNIGTRTMPPPNPKPLKIPAKSAYLIITPKFDSITFSFSFISYPLSTG